MSDEPTLFDAFPDPAPNRVRHHDWPTSLAGARSVAMRAGSQKARLLDAYGSGDAARRGGLTDEEAASLAGVPPLSCYWKRCNELRELGYIVPTGQTRLGVAGVPRIVCAIAETTVG